MSFERLISRLKTLVGNNNSTGVSLSGLNEQNTYCVEDSEFKETRSVIDLYREFVKWVEYKFSGGNDDAYMCDSKSNIDIESSAKGIANIVPTNDGDFTLNQVRMLLKLVGANEAFIPVTEQDMLGKIDSILIDLKERIKLCIVDDEKFIIKYVRRVIKYASHRMRKLVSIVGYPLWGSDGPQISDIQQGSLGDCYFLSALISVIRTRGGNFIKNCFVGVDNSGKILDGAGLGVRFSEINVKADSSIANIYEISPVGDSIVIFVEPTIFVDKDMNLFGKISKSSLWVNVMEKAWTFYRSGKHVTGISTSVFNQLEKKKVRFNSLKFTEDGHDSYAVTALTQAKNQALF